ncbi:VIT family-domain-containing protein [Pavlovales sp. CCMP2436]|nr:VIT family-domain-containing protein [Pavlovales sp. CCMP2436]
MSSSRERVLLLFLALGAGVHGAAEQRPVLAHAVGRVPLLRGGLGGKRQVDAKAQAARADAKVEPSPLMAACRKLTRDHMRGVIFGGLDGILTTFAIIAASIGAKQKAQTTLVLGISTLLADALGMAGGEYLSSKAEREMLSPREVEALIREPSPLAKGAAMFTAFILFGAIPLLGFIASHVLVLYHPELQHAFVSCVVTALALFTLGAVKSQFGKGSWWRSGGEIVLVGGFVASAAFGSAIFVDHIVS